MQNQVKVREVVGIALGVQTPEEPKSEGKEESENGEKEG